jgi:colanic acid/amylovoran biosynthesis glycosyltransferase
MKIAVIVPTFPALSEVFILNQITGLIDLGHDVDLYSFFQNKQSKCHADIDKYRLTQKVRYFNMPNNKVLRFIKALYIVGVNVFRNPLLVFKALNVFKYGNNAASFRLLYMSIAFAKTKYDIIHTFYGPNGSVAATMKDIGIPGKYVASFHGSDLTSFVRSHGNDVYRVLFDKCDLILPISECFKKRLVELGCDASKISIYRMGINLRKFQFNKKKILDGQQVKILSIGRLAEKKGHIFLLMAIKKLAQDHKNICCTIAGTGTLEFELRDFVRQNHLNDIVQFTGAVTHEQAIKLYSHSHLFVLPCVTAKNGDQEGIPNVIKEAQATGMPVISTYHSGIDEVVADGESGFLVPEKDVDALVEKLGYLIEHPELWPKMGEIGCKIVQERYDILKLIHQLEGNYKALLTGA